MTRARAKLIVHVLVQQVEAALVGLEIAFAVRIAVRQAVADLAKDAPDDAAMLDLVRAIEFEADRIEMFGTRGLEAELARARRHRRGVSPAFAVAAAARREGSRAGGAPSSTRASSAGPSPEPSAARGATQMRE